MCSEPSWNCSRMKSCGWSTVTGSMPPDPRRQMRVHRTLFSSAEPPGRHEQMTECDLQRRTARSVKKEIYRRRSMRRFVHYQTQFESDALWHMQPMQPIANQAGDIWVFSCTTKHPCRGIHNTDDQEHTEAHQRGGYQLLCRLILACLHLYAYTCLDLIGAYANFFSVFAR